LALFKYLVRAEKEVLKRQVNSMKELEVNDSFADHALPISGDALWGKYQNLYGSVMRGADKEIRSAFKSVSQEIIGVDLVYLANMMKIKVHHSGSDTHLMRLELKFAEKSKEGFCIKNN